MRQYIQGKTWIPRLIIKDSSGNVMDVSLYTVRYGIKKTRGATKNYADVTADNPVTQFPVIGVAGADGTVTATVIDSITTNVPRGTYWEEFEVSIGSGSSRIVKAWQRQIEVIEPVIS